MRQTQPTMPQVDTAPMGRVRARTLRASRFGATLLSLAAALAAIACGGPAERPGTQEVSGTTEYMVSEERSASCEHGTVVECKVWITDVDCFTGLAVCDHGHLSGCMDADAAEATLEEMNRAVE